MLCVSTCWLFSNEGGRSSSASRGLYSKEERTLYCWRNMTRLALTWSCTTHELVLTVRSWYWDGLSTVWFRHSDRLRYIPTSQVCVGVLFVGLTVSHYGLQLEITCCCIKLQQCASSWFSLICFPVEIACRYQLYISIPITQFFARRHSCLNQISAELSPRCAYRRWSCAHFTPSFFGKEKIDMKYRRFLAVSIQNKFRT